MSALPGQTQSGPPKRKEIYKYEAPWCVYSMNWSIRPDKRFRLALGSFVEEYNNKVDSQHRLCDRAAMSNLKPNPFYYRLFKVLQMLFLNQICCENQKSSKYIIYRNLQTLSRRKQKQFMPSSYPLSAPFGLLIVAYLALI